MPLAASLAKPTKSGRFTPDFAIPERTPGAREKEAGSGRGRSLSDSDSDSDSDSGIPLAKRAKPNPPENITPASAAERVPEVTEGSSKKIFAFESAQVESSESKKPDFEPTKKDYVQLKNITEEEINNAAKKVIGTGTPELTSIYRIGRAERYINNHLLKELESEPVETMESILAVKEGDKGYETKKAAGLILKEILRAKKEEQEKKFISTVNEKCGTLKKLCTTMSEAITDMSAISTGNNSNTIRDNLETLRTQMKQMEDEALSIDEAHKALESI
jgi:hypothetical protein